MADRKFTFISVPSYSKIRAARLAILYPLVGKKMTSEDQILAAGDLIVNQWRARLCALGEVGWSKLEQDARYWLARNCWPTMVGVANDVDQGKKNHMCRLVICPWCCARRAMNLYDKIKSDLKDSSSSAQLQVACGRVRLPQIDANEVPVTPGQLQLRGKDLIRRLLLANQNETAGGYWSVTVEPMYDDKHYGFWQLQMRVLVFVKPKKEFMLVPSNWKSWLAVKPSDNDVVRAVRDVCRFPVGMFRGNPVQTVEALEARDNVRLSGYTGRLRSTKAASDQGVDDDDA